MNYSGKQLKLRLSGDDLSAKELKGLLESLYRVENQVSEDALRAKVIRQLKHEILQDGEVVDEAALGWWDIPHDLIKGKESGPFISMESDLNPSLWFDRMSFSLRTLVTESGKELAVDREKIRSSLQRLGLSEKLARTSAVLVRLKGSLKDDLRSELADYVRQLLGVERCRILFEKRSYGERVAMEFVLFGDFPLD